MVSEFFSCGFAERARENSLAPRVKIGPHLVKNVEFSFSLRLMYNSRLLQQICVYCSANDPAAPEDKFTGTFSSALSVVTNTAWVFTQNLGGTANWRPYPDVIQIQNVGLV